jgi:hypothetical protein
MNKQTKNPTNKSASNTPAATTKASSTKHEDKPDVEDSSNGDVEMSDNENYKLESDVALPKSKRFYNIKFFCSHYDSTNSRKIARGRQNG